VAAAASSSDRWQLWTAERGELFLLYARQRTRTEEDAQDVLQESLTEAWRRSQGEIPDNALVFATIRRRAIDYGRAMDRRQRREDQAASSVEHWFQPDFTAGDAHLTVATALQALPEHLREVVALTLWGDLSFPEIAEITSVPVPTATSRYRYALEKLRETLTPLFS